MRHSISKNICLRFFDGLLIAIFCAVSFSVSSPAFAVAPNQNPVKMFSEDFESGNFSKWSECSNQISTAQVHTGTHSMKFDSNGKFVGPCAASLSPGREVYHKFWWFIPSGFAWNPGNAPGRHFGRISYRVGDQFFVQQIDTGAPSLCLRCFDLVFFVGGNGPAYQPAVTGMPEGRWFKWEYYVRLNDVGVANGETAIWIDGVEKFRRTNVNLNANSNPLNFFAQTSNFDSCTGTGSCNYYMDDVEVWNGCPSGSSCKAGSTPVSLASPGNLTVVSPP